MKTRVCFLCNVLHLLFSEVSHFSAVSNGQSHPAFSSCVEALCPGVRWLGCEADHLPSGTDVKNERSYTFTSPYYFTVCTDTSLLVISFYFKLSCSSRTFRLKAFIVVLAGFMYDAVLKSVGSPATHSGLRREVAGNCALLGLYAASSGGGNYHYWLRNDPEERSSRLLISRY